MDAAAQPAPAQPAASTKPDAAGAPAAGVADGARTPAEAAPEPIALPDIANRAQAVADALGTMTADLAGDAGVESAQAELPRLKRDLQARQAELDALLARAPSIEALRGLDATWKELDRRAADQTRELTRRAGQLEERLADLQRMEASWKLTREPVRAAGGPAGLAAQVDRTIAEIAGVQKAITARRAQVLTLQGQAAQLGGQAREARAAIAKARELATGRLLQRDSPPIWRSGLLDAKPAQLALQGSETLAGRIDGLRAYAAEHEDDFWLHGAFAALCVAGLWALRRLVRRWADQEPELDEAVRIVDAPLVTGALVALLASGLFYQQAPRLWWSAIGIAGVVPTVILTRRVIGRALYPVLYAVVAFYVVDQLRPLLAPSPPSGRLLFLAEMLAGMCFVGWRLALARSAGPPRDAHERRVLRAARGVARLVLAMLAAAAALSCLGFVRLADLVGSATLTSAYLAIVLHAAAEVADGFVAWLLRVRPLSLLEMAHKHRQLLKLRLQHGLRWLAAGAWLLASLDLFAMRQAAFAAVRDALDASVRLGSVDITLGSVLLFAATLWGTWLLSRLIRFTLEEEVYPRVTLARGLTYAISRVVHYVVLLVGFVLALASLGVDMTRFTILVSAFGVGLGFGMQNIVNNFVSGLIVLFERPVEVGDLVQLDDATSGTVERIGIRASVIRTGNGAAVIIPNGRLISDRVTNWTLSSRLRRIEVPVQVDPGRDPEEIIRSLTELARDNAHVLESPPPDVLFVRPGPDKLEFELRAWTHDVERASRIRSDLAVAINRRLGQASATVGDAPALAGS